MTWKKKAASAAVLSLTGKQATAAAATAGATAAGAAAIGLDPVLWGIGAFGGAVAYLYRQADTRPVALANFCVSLMLGGMAAPAASQRIEAFAQEQKTEGLMGLLLSLGASAHLLAVVLALAWPVVVPFAWEHLKKMVGKFTGG